MQFMLLVIEMAYDQTRVANFEGLCADPKRVYGLDCVWMVQRYERTESAIDIDETARKATDRIIIFIEDIQKSPDDLASIIDAGSPRGLVVGCKNKIKISAVNIHYESRGTVFVAKGTNNPPAIVKVVNLKTGQSR